MATLARVPVAHHVTIPVITDRPTAFVDITDRVAAVVREAGLETGLAVIVTRHTTTAVVVNEHEPGLLGDFEACLDYVAPRGRAYAHDDLAVRTVNVMPGERRNGHAHCRALLLPTSACLGVVAGVLSLGRWQRLFLVELDGPQPREVSVFLMG